MIKSWLLLYITGIILLMAIIASCNNSGSSGRQSSHKTAPSVDPDANFEPIEIKYAHGFSIKKYPDYKVLEVYDPWQGADGVSFSYLLAKDGAAINRSLLDEHIFVATPVDRVVCTSTTHIAFLESLQQTGSIVGISGSGLIHNPGLGQRMNSGEVVDIGYEQSMNLESLVMIRPDLIMMYGIESEITAFINKISELDIPVIMNGDYLERTPLGKLEWIKFVAAFYELEQQACEYFDSVEVMYNEVKRTAMLTSGRPRVMEGLPWKDVWYVSSGNTVLSNYIKDAGGLYIWDSLQSSKAVPMDIESVFERAGDADIWINPGRAKCISDIIETDARFRHFSPLVNDKVYNNNRRMVEGGGNDYWESGVTNPHLVLRDLFNIFHPVAGQGPPDASKDPLLVYYRRLQ